MESKRGKRKQRKMTTSFFMSYRLFSLPLVTHFYLKYFHTSLTSCTFVWPRMNLSLSFFLCPLFFLIADWRPFYSHVVLLFFFSYSILVRRSLAPEENLNANYRMAMELYFAIWFAWMKRVQHIKRCKETRSLFFFSNRYSCLFYFRLLTFFSVSMHIDRFLAWLGNSKPTVWNLCALFQRWPFGRSYIFSLLYYIYRFML